MTETARHEKLTESPHRKVAALIEVRLRFEKVITEKPRIKARGSLCFRARN